MVNAFTETEINYPDAIGDFDPQSNIAHAALWIFENDYIQYELGLAVYGIFLVYVINTLKRTN